MSEWALGIIGGSGLYEIEGFDGVWKKIETPFGYPSDEIFDGHINNQRLLFLPRHGRGHLQSPTSINYRANIMALKILGVTDIISLSAVGSLKEEYAPGNFVIPNQFIDRTFAREKSFFGEGLVAHVSMADPTCPRLSDIAKDACENAGVVTHTGGTYLVMEGPQFSTRAESELYRSWNCDIIGMTNMPEAKLAREAQIPYATIGMVTDYDCWHEGHENVDVASVIKVLHENSAKAKLAIRLIAQKLSGVVRTPSPIDKALENAIITAPNKRDSNLLHKLAPILGKD